MNNEIFNGIVGWATIGSFLVNVFTLIYMFYTGNTPFPFAARRIIPFLSSWLLLGVLYFVAFRSAIFLATLSPGTADALVLKATSWAVFLGMLVGLLWRRFIVPWLLPKPEG